MLWKPPTVLFGINAFRPRQRGQRLRNWYVDFEYPARRIQVWFDTSELTVDLLINQS